MGAGDFGEAKQGSRAVGAPAGADRGAGSPRATVLGVRRGEAPRLKVMSKAEGDEPSTFDEHGRGR